MLTAMALSTDQQRELQKIQRHGHTGAHFGTLRLTVHFTHAQILVKPTRQRPFLPAARLEWDRGRTTSSASSRKTQCTTGKNKSVELNQLPGFATPGPLRERLSGLVLAGVKTATFDLFDFARFDPSGVPAAGGTWTMHDSIGRALALLNTTAVEVLRLADVTFAMAQLEGESFSSAQSWRHAHENYWSPFVDEVRAQTKDPKWSLTDNTLVVFETFVVAERLDAADEGRYPVVELMVPSGDMELAAADLYELDTVGIEELSLSGSGVSLRAGFASDDAGAIAEQWLWANHAEWIPRFEVIVGDNWLDAWREHFVPVQVGTLRIVPDWDGAQPATNDASPPGTRTMLLDPKRAWGTGAHASTALVLGALQSPFVTLTGARVLDVGCGSGILAIATLMLGASSAHGIDVDRTAITVTMENARRNGVENRCSAAWTPIEEVHETFDVVVANILAPVLIELANDLQRVTRPEGTLVLAGLIDEQVERVRAAFGECSVVESRADGAWRAILLRR